MNIKKQLILASASPRRKELLTQIGIQYECIPAVGEELITSQDPTEVVRELALQKAVEVAEKRKEGWILAADTVVSYQNQILGKPADEQHAEQMLEQLQGKGHQVYTGVCLLEAETGKRIHFEEKTDVYLYPMSRQEILDYIATKEPMDKAGAYAIQGRCAAYIEHIEGDYYNVVGLPIGKVYQVLKSL